MKPNLHSPVLTQPLKWHGGKHYLAKKIIEMMPTHVTYVEPYAGGLSVLLTKDHQDCNEVVNDRNHELIEFWRVLADQTLFAQFQRFVDCIPFSEWHWDHVESIRSGEYASGYDARVCRAVAFFVFCRLSMAGRMKSFAPLTKTRLRRRMNEQASAWLNAVEGLSDVHERLKRVAILDDDAVTVIQKMDCPVTLVYADPPYLHETRATTGEYDHEMTEAQHVELLDVLAKMQGKFLLSGYRSPLYDEYAQRSGWRLTEVELPNNAASGGEKRRMVECIWSNFGGAEMAE